MQFQDLDAWDRQALLDWYNVVELDDDDRRRLVALFEAGQFSHWRCPTCGDHCTHGEPDDWGHFQGVRNQDYISFPGDPELFTNECRRLQCDTCRAFGTPAQRSAKSEVPS